MLTPEEMRVLERNSEFYGVSVQALMENAGRAVADTILRKYSDIRKVIVLCGSGNNGGDGIVAARYLQESGIDVKVSLVGKELKTELAKKALSGFVKKGGKVIEFKPEVLSLGEIIVDAMLGIGISGEPRDPYVSAIKAVNASRKPVVSVDVPSGLGSSNVIIPEVVVTFHDIKEGLDKCRCKEIIVADIGIPEEAIRKTGPGEMILYPVPGCESHKGENGIVLIVGGGAYHGAPVFAGLSAYRTGVDLVYMSVPEKIAPMIQMASPSFIVRGLQGEKITEMNIERLFPLSGYHSVVVGPGAGKDEEILKGLLAFIKRCELPMVVDADGIHALALEPNAVKNKQCILTPHAGELTTLLKAAGVSKTGREGAVELAKRLNVAVLLKGRVDIITDGKRVKENHFGNPGMSVGGTGDVLAGCCAALMAKGLCPYDAARVGIYIVTQAGDLAFIEKSYGLMAEDVIEAIPHVLVKHLGAQ